MRQADKQNRNTHSLHITRQTVEKAMPTKRYLLPGAHPHTNAGTKNHSHQQLKKNHHTTFHRNTQIDQDSSATTEIPTQKLKPSPENNKMREQMPPQNYIPYKNDQKMRQIFESCIDQRFRRVRDKSRPSPQATTLIFKIDKKKDQSAFNLRSRDSNPGKSNGFAINIKDLHRKNKKKVGHDRLDCRIVNIFQTIQQNIKPIHRQRSSIKYYGKALLKDVLQNMVLQHIPHDSVIDSENALATASQTPSLEAERFIKSINMTEDNPQSLMRVKRKQEVTRYIKTKRILQGTKQTTRREQVCQREYELKPWSIPQIPIEI